MTFANGRRVTVSLGPRASQDLAEISLLLHENHTALINKAIHFYAAARRVQEGGGALYLRKPNVNSIERVQLF